jgi:hypothetical protein
MIAQRHAEGIFLNYQLRQISVNLQHLWLVVLIARPFDFMFPLPKLERYTLITSAIAPIARAKVVASGTSEPDGPIAPRRLERDLIL